MYLLVYESLRKQHKYLEVPRLGILFDEIPKYDNKLVLSSYFWAPDQ